MIMFSGNFTENSCLRKEYGDSDYLTSLTVSLYNVLGILI